LKQKKKFEAIIFDIDDTLFDSTFMSQSARRNAIRAMHEAGIELDENETFELLLKIVKKYGSNYNEHFNRLLEELEYEPHPKLIAAAVVAYHSEKEALLRPFPDVILTLLTLIKTQHKLGIISDGIREKQWEKLIYLGIQHFFDVVVINELRGNWKPDNHGFKIAMEKLGLTEPEKIIYVGNKIESDIVGANKIGMISVLFDPKNLVKLDNLIEFEKPNHIIKRISEISRIVGIDQIKWRY